MSTKTQIKTQLRDAKAVGEAAQNYLGELLKAQEGTRSEIGVTFDAAASRVKMHGSERSEVNGGVISFSDSEYQVGLNTDKDGNLTLVYDSWVAGGLMSRRMSGTGAIERPTTNDSAAHRAYSEAVRAANPAGNLQDCLNLHKVKTQCKKIGRQVRHRIHEKRLQAFVVAR